MKGIFLPSITALFLVLSTAQAALIDRGGGLIYDDVLDITWLQDGNYAQTSGYDADGLMTWDEAKVWANQLVYSGLSDWRLASVGTLLNPTNPCTANDGSCDRGYNNTNGELGYMYYNNLSNLGILDTSGNPQPGGGFSNSSFANNGNTNDIRSFQNVMWADRAYWYNEVYINDNSGFAWALGSGGGQFNRNRGAGFPAYSWAVMDGDVSAVPVPAAIWLFCSALGLLGWTRRKAT